MVEKEIEEGKLQVIRPLDFAVPEIVSYCVYRRGNALAEQFLGGI